MIRILVIPKFSFLSFFDSQIGKSFSHDCISSSMIAISRGGINVVKIFFIPSFCLMNFPSFNRRPFSRFTFFQRHFPRWERRRFYNLEIIRTKNVLLLLIKLREAEAESERKKKNFWHDWSSLLILTSKAGYFPWNENVA